MIMKALILGFGQDAKILSHILEQKNVEYVILARDTENGNSSVHCHGIDPSKINFVPVLNAKSIKRIIQHDEFTHIFNFAASSVAQTKKLNFKFYLNNNSNLLWDLFEIISEFNEVWLFHPLSSEILENCNYKTFQEMQINPTNAYGLSKSAEYFACQIHHKNSNLLLNSCILYNHESKYRSDLFFTKKVTSAVRKALIQKNSIIDIYNCKSQRDWGSAYEFMSLIYKSAMKQISGLTVLGTGNSITVENFIDYSFEYAGIPFEKEIFGGLLRWNSEFLTVNEVSRDLEDERLMRVAPPELVVQSFGEIPRISGRRLVEELLIDND